MNQSQPYKNHPIFKILSKILENIEAGIQHAFEKLQLGPATIALRYSANRIVHLTGFIVEENKRNQGHGKKLLQILTKWADKNNIFLRLFASSTDRKLNIADLVTIYKKHGFKQIEQKIVNLYSDMVPMVREPLSRKLCKNTI